MELVLVGAVGAVDLDVDADEEHCCGSVWVGASRLVAQGRGAEATLKATSGRRTSNTCSAVPEPNTGQCVIKGGGRISNS